MTDHRAPTVSRLLIALLCLATPRATLAEATRCGGRPWVGAWAGPPSDASSAGTPQIVLNDQTVRAMLTPTAAGAVLRVRLSNRFRSTPVTFERVTIARQAAGAAIVPASLRTVRFRRRRRVEVQAGQDVWSDAVRLRVRPFETLAVSVWVAGDAGAPTRHATALQTSYLNDPGAGDATRDVAGARFTRTTTTRPWVTGLDVRPRRSTGAVVAVGDSLTDGATLLALGAGFPGVLPSALDANVRYPDFLARRILSAGLPLSVLNAGIAGNMLLADSLRGGEPLLTRYLPDVLGQSGVTTAIVWIGANDIAFFATPEQLIQGYETVIQELRRFGLRVLHGTITPFKGFPALAGYFEQLEGVRDAVNQWIRTRSPADGVVDFDLAVRDPADPDRLHPSYDDGEHLHFSPEGYKRLAEAVPLEELALPRCRSTR